jgi:hypothetical protein
MLCVRDSLFVVAVIAFCSGVAAVGFGLFYAGQVTAGPRSAWGSPAEFAVTLAEMVARASLWVGFTAAGVCAVASVAHLVVAMRAERTS